MLAGEAEANAKGSEPVYNIGELMNEDEELQKLHEDRIEQLKSEREKRAEMQRTGHGQVTEVTEGDFLEEVTKTEAVVCHFFHRDFERCKIMDKHLAELARKHFNTKFIKMSAPVRAGRLECMCGRCTSAVAGAMHAYAHACTCAWCA